MRLRDQKQWTEALESFEKAIALDARNPQAWALKGRALDEMNNLSEAIRCYKTSLDLNPNSVRFAGTFEERMVRRVCVNARRTPILSLCTHARFSPLSLPIPFAAFLSLSLSPLVLAPKTDLPSPSLSTPSLSLSNPLTGFHLEQQGLRISKATEVHVGVGLLSRGGASSASVRQGVVQYGLRAG